MPKTKKALLKKQKRFESAVIAILAIGAIYLGYRLLFAHASVAPAGYVYEQSGSTGSCNTGGVRVTKGATVNDYATPAINHPSGKFTCKGDNKAWQAFPLGSGLNWYGPYTTWNVTNDRNAGYNYYTVSFYYRSLGQTTFHANVSACGTPGCGYVIGATLVCPISGNGAAMGSYTHATIRFVIRTGQWRTTCLPSQTPRTVSNTNMASTEHGVEYRFGVEKGAAVNVDKVTFTKS